MFRKLFQWIREMRFNLYWFINHDENIWTIIAAPNEERAWELFVLEMGDEFLTVQKAQRNNRLYAVTAVNKNEGTVAIIASLESEFNIRNSRQLRESHGQEEAHFRMSELRGYYFCLNCGNTLGRV